MHEHRLRFARQSVDEIHADIAETRCAREFHGLSRLRARVDAADAFQECIVKSLHAKGQAVDAARAQESELRFIDGPRIALHREFRPLRLVNAFPGKCFRNGLQDLLKQSHIEHARRAAAHVDGLRPAPLLPIKDALLRELAAQGVRVICLIALPPGKGREVAVKALLAAERDVDVEAPSLFPHRVLHQSIFKMAMKASCGTSTLPTAFMRFLPSFCFSSSLRLREISPP